ncbi:sugar transferase [Streptomyces sp. W1SF4]|uniref:sugar transferase n=1 Tax=Streptomyces sp. W1SF4 TaxID=2305220 RepID=UPI000F6F9DD8|nr:sugar transferase [Streptomyces sp. W1SF4]AZM89883.1 sugar transferase [Streptomyces sp. W1SF4]
MRLPTTLTARPGPRPRPLRIPLPAHWPARPPAKRVFDLVGAAVLLAAAAVPVLAAAALLYAATRARVLVREPALGLGGRPFLAWRLRTEDAGRAGALVRRCALEGLPQLLNVARGEMSLVGPRPQACTDHPERLLVRPGMTGLWQVSTRSGLPWEEMALLDRHYVESHWLGMDLAILAQTPRAAYRQRHA